MNPYARIVAVGAVGLIVFDAIAATASRSLGFAYARASIGSFMICTLIGFLVGKVVDGRRALQGVVAGLTLGFTDATLGWVVGSAFGGGSPHRHLTPIAWLIVCCLVMATYTVFTCLGYGVAALMSWNRTRNPVG